MPTLLTDPRSGGIKKSSGVNVLPIIAKTWEEVRDDTKDISFLLATYCAGSNTDITLYKKGSGGLEECCRDLQDDIALFGGVRLSSGRFMHFYHCGANTKIMVKGRASMHKNGVFNVLEGCDGEIPEIWKGMKESDIGCASSKMDVNNIHQNTSTTSISAVADIEKSNVKSAVESAVIPSLSSSKFIPYSILKTIQDTSSLGIDSTRKEMALSDDEFHQIMNVTKEDFLKLPEWRRKKMKQDVGLF